jgi:dTDP-4-amino-4,6-dideoxygalactose transaminase
MSNLAAALIRAQLAEVGDQISAYQRRYGILTALLSASPYIRLPEPLAEVSRAPDTLQFHLLFDRDGVQRFVTLLAERGVQVKIFGAPGNPRFFKSWQYIEGIDGVDLPNTERILLAAGDLRLPGYLTDADARAIGETMCDVADEVGRREVVHGTQLLPVASAQP